MTDKLTAKDADEIFKVKDQFKADFPFGGGGIVNNMSGMGGATDKSTGSFYTPTIFNSANQLQIIYAQSWAARKFIDIPVDDQFILGRTFESDDESLVEKIEEFEDNHNLSKKIADAQKAGRLYGTGLLWFVTAENDPGQPLNIEQLKPGDLRNLIVVDRYNIQILNRQMDPMQPDYLEPLQYQITLPFGSSVVVHSSRVCRFNGKESLTVNGFQNYGDQFFGLSELTDALITIQSEDTLSRSIAHLTNEASIPVIKIDQFNDAICGEGADFNLDDRLAKQSMAKSNFRTTFIDVNDDFIRVNVSFAGLPDLMDRFADRLAASADIPKTRFLGQSPQGLSATGESDMKNYAMSIQSRQEKILRPVYSKIDPMISRFIGVKEIPPFEFPSLIDADDKSKADTLSSTSTGLLNLITAGVIEEGEARDVLRQSQLFKSLEDEDAIENLEKLAGTISTASKADDQVSLNGAQITSMLSIIEQVSAGILPQESAIAMLSSALPFSEEQASNMVSGIGRTPAGESVGVAING